MLNTADNSVVAADVATVSPADLHNPVIGDEFQHIVDIFKQEMQRLPPTPDLYSSPDFGDLGDEFLTTYSPEDELLNTPVVAEDDVLTGMWDGDMLGGALFPTIDYGSSLYSNPSIPVDKPAVPPPLNDLQLYTFTPESPALHDFSPAINPSSIYPSPRLPSDRSSFPSPATSIQPLPRRKSSANGTRKGVTPQALVPVDAPTQPRKYLTPSATSRKELPSVFAKKRARSVAFGDDDDEQDVLEPLGPNPSEKDLIEYKRRQNTVAARRSRKRKLEYQQGLEDRVKSLEAETARWRERAEICQGMLANHGLPYPTFDED